MSTKLTNKQIIDKLKRSILEWKKNRRLYELGLIDGQTHTEKQIYILKDLGFK